MPLEKNDQIQARLDKLEKIREQGINPYPYKYEVSHSSKELLETKDSLLESEETISYAGRVNRYNRKGKMLFMHIKDRYGRLQVLVAKNEIGEEAYELAKMIDIGDWVGVRGPMFVTRTGEYSVHVKEIQLLSKAVRPLPIPKEKTDENGNKVIFDQFSDMESRYRFRATDLSLNDEVREVFYKRSAIISSVRQYLLENNFLEVETPALQAIYGGANARPFTTHHNAADIDLYLRVSNELYLKRCIAGGFERVFEFSTNFRNEGMDRTHNPEFTLLEFYQAYADYNDMMIHFENIYEKACLAANGTTKVSYQGQEIDFKTPWPRLTMYQALKEFASLDVENMNSEELQAELKKQEIELDGAYSDGRAVLALFEELVEDKLIQPHFIIDFPRESTPLCKLHRSNPELVEQFEPYINGWEVGNAYSELNDPLLQREMLEEQVERGRGGEQETHPVDENFLNAVEIGMPPTGGCGIGIDRMVMLLTDSSTIRDVILFPLMKPRD